MKKLLATLLIAALIFGFSLTTAASTTPMTSLDANDDDGVFVFDGDNEENEAAEEIREAEEQIQKASSKIDEAEANGLSVTDVKSLLGEANNTLSQAEAAYNADPPNYEKAEQLAEEAKHLAEKAKRLAEDILGKSGGTEHSIEEEDEEDDEELGSSVDEDGDLHITSSDNTIEFKSTEPTIHFAYFTNETEIEFVAGDFALIEFNNSKVMQRLEFDHIPWNVVYNETVVGDNTIITVTYYANTTEYEIALIMYVYQKSTTQSSATWNGTVVFDVDGGGDEVKFDLNVTRWTWVVDAPSSQLALFMELEAEVEGEVSSGSAGIDEDQITVELDDIGIQISWVKEAKIIWPNGASEFVNVTVTYESWELEGGGGEVELELEVYFTYPYFGGNKLFHDPSIGIEDDPLLYIFTLITPEILLGTAITAIALVTAGVILARRKRKLPPLQSSSPIAL